MHTYPKAKRYVLLFVLLLFSLSTLGCGLLGKLGQAVSDEEISGEQPPAGEKPPAEQEPPVGQEPPSEGNPPAGKDSTGTILESYRSRTTMRMQNEDGSELVTVTTIEWTRDPLALRTITSSESGEVVMETIMMEGTVWAKMPDGSWQKTGTEEVLDDTMGYMPEIPNLDNMDLKGKETVNGIQCKHYVNKVPPAYEIWIADQKDIPPIAIRVYTKMASVITEIDIYDINVPITIEPPQ